LCGTGENQKAIIFELKVVEKDGNLQAACENALKQIEERKYAAKWVSYGYRQVIKYGVGFCKKYCRVIKGE
jgi:hypothetical protein